MRTLPHENKMSELLAVDSDQFNLFLEYLLFKQNEIRDMMPTATDGFGKLQAQWSFLEGLTRDDGNDLRARMRQFWVANAPRESRKPFKD